MRKFDKNKKIENNEKKIFINFGGRYYPYIINADIWNLNKEERKKLFWHEYENHKFKNGESYDFYLYKMLGKYDLDLDDYYIKNATLVKN